MYVYQNENKLYWIMLSEYITDFNLIVPIHVYTNKPELLPEARRIQSCIDLSFSLSDTIEYDKYVMYEIEMPDTFPITYLHTGLYDSVNSLWICDDYFQVNRLIGK